MSEEPDSGTDAPWEWDERGVIVADLPPLPAALTPGFWGMLIAILGLFLAFTMMIGGWGVYIYAVLTALACVAFLGWLLGCVARWPEQSTSIGAGIRNIERESASTPESDIGEGYAALMRGLRDRRNGLYQSNHGFGDFALFQTARDEMHLPHIPAVVSSVIWRRLPRARPDLHLLDPEPIPTLTIRMNTSIWLMLAVILAVVQARTPLAGLLLIGSLAFCLTALAVPRFQGGIPLPGLWSKAIVLGLGVVESLDGRRWTVTDSTLFLTTGSVGLHCQCWLVGPAGWLGIKFKVLDDPRFIELWQRWNHPRPRTDLPLMDDARSKSS